MITTIQPKEIVVKCIVIVFLVLAMLPGCSTREQEGAAASGEAAGQYTCPMHPSVLSDRPGACPVCNMALVRKSAQKEMSAGEEAMLRTVTLSPSQRVLANVATTQVAMRALAREIALPGVVDHAEPLQATITSRVRGRVEKLHVNTTGGVVRRGGALCDIYSPDLITAQQEYLTMLTTTSGATGGDASTHGSILATARRRLLDHFGMSEAQVQELETTRRVRETVTIHTTIGGTVVRKEVREGQYVAEGGVLFQISDLSRVWVYAEVGEGDLRFVRRGQPVTLRADAWPGVAFQGSVTFIDPVVNTATRTVRVRAEFPNDGGRLKPGMFVQAVIGASVGAVTAVPTTAIINTGTRSVVWVEARSNQFEPRTVTTGIRSEGFTEITSGLSEGETVVVSGGYLIDSESQLQNPDAWRAANTAPAPATGSAEPPAAADAGTPVRTIRITVDLGYEPEVIRVKKGETVRLLFDRKEDSECSEEVVFKDFGIKRFLPAFKATPILLTPTNAGTFTFSCGMDMLHGRLIVEEK